MLCWYLRQIPVQPDDGDTNPCYDLYKHHLMIKKRTRPQTRVRDHSQDPSDSAQPTDSQQETSDQNQDERDLPYAFRPLLL